MHMHPVKQHFEVLNHLKATDGLKNLPPGAFYQSGVFPLFFFVSGQPTRRVLGQPKKCVFVHALVSCMSL